MPLGRLLSATLAGYFRCNIGDRVHRDAPLQFIDEGAAGFLDRRRVGARDAVYECSESHCEIAISTSLRKLALLT